MSATGAPNRTKIIQISDPHFGTTTEAKKQALLDSIHEIEPNLILLSGDITQRATEEQFHEARAFVEKLAPIDVITVPGNHDISLWNVAKRLLNPYGDFKHAFGGKLDHRWAKGSIEVIGLNSTSSFRHTQGDLLDADFEKLKSFSPDTSVRLLMFHHPMDCAKHIDSKNLLKNSSIALKRFEEANIDIILGGHVHDPLARLSDKRYEGITRPIILSVAGTCLSSRTRYAAPNSFNFIDVYAHAAVAPGLVREADIRIHRYDMSVEGKFSACLEARFARNNTGVWRDVENPTEISKALDPVDAKVPVV